MSATLTDRYVHAVTRNLAPDQRPEVARELRAMIDDLISARVDDLPDPSLPAALDEIERAVLTSLGDPNRLAANYVDKPRALIGQELFPEYLRVLKLVVGIALPTLVFFTLVGTGFSDDRTVGNFIGSAANAAYHAVIQSAFWVTLVYAFAHHWKDPAAWTPDELPDVSEWGEDLTGRAVDSKGGTVKVSDMVFGIVFTVLVGVLLVWQHQWPFLSEGGEGIPFLHPEIWNGAAQAILATLAASVAVQAVVLARRRWSWTLAGANVAINVASVAIAAWLAFDHRVINPEFLTVVADRANWDSVPSPNPWVILLIVLAIEAWDAGEALWGAYRNHRARSVLPAT